MHRYDFEYMNDIQIRVSRKNMFQLKSAIERLKSVCKVI